MYMIQRTAWIHQHQKPMICSDKNSMHNIIGETVNAENQPVIVTHLNFSSLDEWL